MQRIRRPGGEAGAASPDRHEHSPPVPVAAPGVQTPAMSEVRDTLGTEAPALELPMLEAAAAAHDTGDHAGHDHDALGLLALAGQDNPLRRQSDPLPVDPGPIHRIVCGIRIGGTGISPSALDAAQRVVEALLGGNPQLQENLQSANIEIVIVPAGTDVPDMMEFDGIEGFEVRDAEDSEVAPEVARQWRDTRGVGGHHHPTLDKVYIGFPEENLIDSDVRYDTYGANQNISMHELAHQVQLAGMTPEQATRLQALYDAAKGRADGFIDGYAADHPQEYFAQGTQYFFAASDYSGRFDARSDIDDPADGPAWLQANDEGLYAFLVELYGTPSEGLERANGVDVRREGEGTPVTPLAAPPVA